jgi:hypothetical protein
MRRRVTREVAIPTMLRIARCFDPETSSALESDSPKVIRFNDSITKRLDSLRLTAAKLGLVSLSSNQVETRYNSYFILNTLCNSIGQWTNAAYSNPVDFEEIINPQII